MSVPAAESTTEVSPEDERERSVEELDDSENVETLRQAVADITTERDALQVQLQEVTQMLEHKKARIKELWRMSCGQVEEFDAMVVTKDDEIAALKAQLAEQKRQRTPSSSDVDTVSISERQRSKDSRRGRAPPIDIFTGEDPSVRLDDWLPGLNLASRWNDWTPEERLIQLAGHLRGCAEAEWNLLSTDETRNFERANHNLRERLDPCSKVLAGQDFRRTVQTDNETVADYACRLEKAFRIAFGNDKLSKETKETMLYGQMQEGLRLGILRSPSVLGAMSYEELCMAAKNEEQRQTELRKRQDYNRSHNSFPSNGKYDDRSTKDKSFKPRTQTGGGSQASSSGDARQQQRCYLCNQLGHIAKHCKQNKSKEKESSSQKSGSVNSQVTTKPSEKPSDVSGIADPHTFLFSDSDSSVDTVRVDDKGSKPQHVSVQVQGVPTSGIIDTGTDITIMGGKLFEKVAAAARLKKRDFRKPDHVPWTYDRKKFQLHGRMDLEIIFEGKVLRTPIYIKMDAHDQLLLSEGVCSQLGIVEYHQNVWPGRQLPSAPDASVVVARQVRVLRTTTVPAGRAVRVAVAVSDSNGQSKSGPLLLEGSHDTSSVTVHNSLVQPDMSGRAIVTIQNDSGFTERITEGSVLGQVTDVLEVVPSDQGDSDVGAVVGQVSCDSNYDDTELQERKRLLAEKFGHIDLPSR